jgi:hypothetical protein
VTSHSVSTLTNSRRNSQPAGRGKKDAPKSAAARPKQAAGNAAKAKGGRRANTRRKPATKEQLDAEMTDYFGGTAPATTAPAATAVTAANPSDVKMDDEVL